MAGERLGMFWGTQYSEADAHGIGVSPLSSGWSDADLGRDLI